VVDVWKGIEQNEQEKRKRGEALEETTEDSRKGARRDALCVRDWPESEKVKRQESSKGSVRSMRRKGKRSIEIEHLERGKIVMVLGSGSGEKC